jgi:hypothetical protein
MLRNSRFITTSILLFTPIAALIALVSFTNASTASANPALQATPPAAGTGQVTTVKCVPVQVSVSDKRVHVKCQTGVGPIVYFAAATDDKGTATNYLTIMLDAISGKKQLFVDVLMDDLTGEPYGCKNADCRPIQAVSIEQ